jgi:hypothetical protein
MAGSCADVNEHWISIRCREILELLRDYLFPKRSELREVGQLVTFMSSTGRGRGSVAGTISMLQAARSRV